VLQMKGERGEYRSTVLEGFWMRVEWLWDLPPEMQVVKEWGLV